MEVGRVAVFAFRAALTSQTLAWHPFGEEVAQVVRSRPALHCRTPVVTYSLKVEPREHFLTWQQDPHGNFLARAVFPEKTRHLSLEVDLVAELTVEGTINFLVDLNRHVQRTVRYAIRLDPGVQTYDSWASSMAWWIRVNRALGS